MSKLCETCIHQPVCMKDKNIVGDVYVAPHPVFFDEEYRKKTWEDFKEREAKGFPCDDYMKDDVAPVKHGKWIEDGYDDEPFVCSECGEPCISFCMGKPRWNYCPWCGAHMDGGEP